MVCVQLKNCCWKIFVSARIKLQWALGCRCNKWCVGIRNLQIESMCPAPKQLPNKNCVKAALANRCYVMLRLGFCQTIFLDGVCCPTKPMMNKKQKMKKCTNDEQRLSSWWGSKLRLQVDGRLVGACIQRLTHCWCAGIVARQPEQMLIKNKSTKYANRWKWICRCNKCR